MTELGNRQFYLNVIREQIIYLYGLRCCIYFSLHRSMLPAHTCDFSSPICANRPFQGPNLVILLLAPTGSPLFAECLSFQVPICFYKISHFRKATCSSCCLPHAGFLLDIFSDPDDGSDMFLRNI
jgi:hypothetical protein